MTSLVYFVAIGKHVKIGRTHNLEQRLRSFKTSTSEEIRVIATIPGGHAEETRLHYALAGSRIRGEFFHFEWRLQGFIRHATAGQIEAAWRFLDETDPEQIVRQAEENRRARIAAARKSKAELNSYFADLVSERKRTRGW